MPTQERLAVARTRLPLSVVAAAFTLVGCTTHPMMPTPALYTGENAKPLFTDIAADRRTPPLDLLYITDRTPATSPGDSGPYTASSSRYLALVRRPWNSVMESAGTPSSRKAR